MVVGVPSLLLCSLIVGIGSFASIIIVAIVLSTYSVFSVHAVDLLFPFHPARLRRAGET
jgi:hypothetical protein